MDLTYFLEDFKGKRDFDETNAAILSNPGLEAALFDLIIKEEEYPDTHYVTWILGHFAKKYPEKCGRHYTTLIDAFLKHQGETVSRNLAVILLSIEFQEYKEGELLERLLNILQNPMHKVALHVYAIYLSMKFCEKYPELKDEIRLLITELMEHPTPALKVAAKKFEKLYRTI